MAKTPEQLLAEMLAGGNAVGGTTGADGPAATTSPVSPFTMLPPKTGNMGYDGPGMSTGPVKGPGIDPYTGPAATTSPVNPWHAAINPPKDHAGGYTGPAATTGPVSGPSAPSPTVGPIDPGAPGYTGPAATTGPVGSPFLPLGPKTGEYGSDPSGAQSNVVAPPASNVPAGQRGGRYSSNDVAALIKQLTGRDATPQESQQWGNDIDENYYNSIRQAIANSAEAKAYAQQQQTPAQPAAPAAGTTGAGGDTNWLMTDFSNPDNVRRYFQSRGVTPSNESIDYWARKYNSPEFAGDRQYFLKRLAGAEEFGGGVAGGEFNDPWGSALEGQTGAYSAAARERAAALAKILRDRAAQLNQPAYTSGDEAVIRAKAFDQLERRRQETLKNGRESVYARGFAPTSGLVQDTQNKTNQTFEGARTGIESNLLQSSLDENNRRKDQAVQLEQLATQALNGGDLSAIQALSGPLGLMNTRQQTAGSLLNNSNSQSMNAILQILAMLQQNQGANNGQAGSQAAGYGALIPILLQALGGS